MVDISVIMPVYNTEDYLIESIESVVGQKQISWELICIDDGSSDSSLKILKEYEKLYPQIHVITQTHQGLSIARNTGINLAKGRYIYFMDSDDYLEEEALSYMVTVCDKEKLDVFFMSFRNICDDSDLGEKYSKMINKKKRQHSFPKPTDGQSLFCCFMEAQEYFCMVWGYCCSSEFIHTNNLRFPENIYYEDQVFTYSVLNYARRACCVDKVIYNKRIRTGSICVNSDLYEYTKGYTYTIQYLKDMIAEIKSMDSLYYKWSKQLLNETIEKLQKKLHTV
ncbi:MAG: glycosyltransferase family 2 protein [Ruminococcus sp.]